MSKRTELMLAEDRAKVCELLARGTTNRSEMARIINQGRPEEFHISAQQVGKDIKHMEEEYLEQGFENLEIYRHRAMNELLYLLKLCYEGYEKSRVNKITIETLKTFGTAEDYDEEMEATEFEQEPLDGMDLFARDGKVKEEFRGEGNPAFLNAAKGVLDSLNKVRSVDGATKVALTDATGTEEYAGIAELMKARMNELSVRDAPTDTDKYLLEKPKEDEDAVDGHIIDGENEEWVS